MKPRMLSDAELEYLQQCVDSGNELLLANDLALLHSLREARAALRRTWSVTNAVFVAVEAGLSAAQIGEALRRDTELLARDVSSALGEAA